jgi:two-component system sensor histidine kinase YesM
MDKQARRMKLFPKLIAVLVIVMLPICAMGMVANSNERRVIRQTFMESMQSKLSFYVDSLESEVKRFRELLYYYTNNDLQFSQVAIIYDFYNDYEKTDTIKDIIGKLRQVYQTSPYIENVYLYLPNQGRSINAKNYDYDLAPGVVERLKMALPYQGQLGLFEGALTLCSAFPDRVSKSPVMVMRIDIDQTYLSETLAGIEQMEGSGTALIGDHWGISKQGLLSGQELAEIDALFSGNEYLALREYSGILGASVVIYIPWQSLTAMVRGSQTWVVLLFCMATLLLLGATFIIYRVAYEPIRRMVEAFTLVESGNRHIRLVRRGNDEFFYLYDQFNAMMNTLDKLYKQSYEQEIRWQKAQYKQLQSQINPHFFYNTFFTLQGMILMDEKEPAARMLRNLGAYFQFITRSGSEYIPLTRELAHAVAYCEIQMMRFENIRVDIEEIPAGFEDMSVPRLILQPLVENSFLHGLENSSKDGYIAIRFVVEEPFLIIEIANNGESISDEALAEMNTKLQADDPAEITAILNINRRLKLFFGDAAGICLEKNTPTGLIVKLYLKKVQHA